MKKVRIIFLSSILFLTFTFQYSYSQLRVDANEAFGDRLVIGLVNSNWQQLNPYQVNMVQQKEILRLIFGYGLIQNADKFESPPPMIDRYVYRGQGNREVRYVLKRNIVFHDGSDLRNTDVKFTFEVLRKFGGHILNRQIELGNVKSISTEGDLEVVFELHQPDKNFDIKLNDIPILSSRYYQDILLRGYSVFSEKPPMGLGPFVFLSQNNDVLNLTYHAHYFTGRPFLNNISARFFKDEQDMINALVNGELDFVEIQDQGTAKQLHQLMGSKIIVFTVPRPEKKLYFLLMNQRNFPFSEPEVRQAIYYALNREQIVGRFLHQNGNVAHSIFDKENPHYFKQMFREEFDPSKALQILNSAGWQVNKQTGILEKNGQPLIFDLFFTKNSFLEESIARTIKIYLGEMNINVQPIPVSPELKKELPGQNNFDATIYDYIYDPRYLHEAVLEFYNKILGGNSRYPNYKNIYLDQLFSLAERDPSILPKLYQRFQFYLKREMPAIFLFFDDRAIIAVNSRFRNVRTTFNNDGNFYYRLIPFENWFVPKSLQKESF